MLVPVYARATGSAAGLPRGSGASGEGRDMTGFPLPRALVERLCSIRSCGAITGAGVSDESGIRTYRGPGGLYDDPEMLTDIFQISNEFNKEAARQCVAAGCDAMWISDDLGDSTRGFMKLDHFREYYLPHLMDLTEYIDGLGVPVLLHCCGRFTDYLPDLSQTRIASIHPLQRTWAELPVMMSKPMLTTHRWLLLSEPPL